MNAVPNIKEGDRYWYQGCRDNWYPVLVDCVYIAKGAATILGRRCDETGRAIGCQTILVKKWIGDRWGVTA